MGIILILLMILSSEIEQSRAVEASLSVDAVHGASGVPGGHLARSGLRLRAGGLRRIG
ncbi:MULTISPECIES: hypothetical protein [Xanthomonas]|uniref:hypothetical protein n=1 Tax=Xanthomonas TaxID=338 RepID=UPI000AE52264|nr:hypothetical protein [Xanthomonas oryzae]QIF21948.1 hypothetical protein G6N84_06300 [Xanthomonas oryzae pv. oryzae]UQA41278.1 hypothetical protein KX727_08645 [Xanthomonas oryzae pv. oryzae]UQA44904.1 hypothetical protein KX725_08660 [Xanthomonas oryzae pv. oryzae]UQA48531.1 hypothetical protein KX726_08635 [Xanthomonas oryzae pv. oryzae]UXV90981.1 hypothetical protein IXO597_015755 [Xanthomonas oryzae pv. oryzae]